jgi:hypothetical protein
VCLRHISFRSADLHKFVLQIQYPVESLEGLMIIFLESKPQDLNHFF